MRSLGERLITAVFVTVVLASAAAMASRLLTGFMKARCALGSRRRTWLTSPSEATSK